MKVRNYSINILHHLDCLYSSRSSSRRGWVVRIQPGGFLRETDEFPRGPGAGPLSVATGGGGGEQAGAPVVPQSAGESRDDQGRPRAAGGVKPDAHPVFIPEYRILRLKQLIFSEILYSVLHVMYYKITFSKHYFFQKL